MEVYPTRWLLVERAEWVRADRYGRIAVRSAGPRRDGHVEGSMALAKYGATRVAVDLRGSCGRWDGHTRLREEPELPWF